MTTHAGIYLGGLFRSSSAANIGRRRKPTQFHKVAKPKRAPKPRPAPVKRDEVAEHLSDGLGLDQIAERMGITRKAVDHHFAKIRQGLGEQAR
jgi:DNA-binding NarL/FixJ family response regulator